MITVTISSNFEVAIPREICEKFGWQPGQKLAFTPYNDHLHIITVSPIEQLGGPLDTTEMREEDEAR